MRGFAAELLADSRTWWVAATLTLAALALAIPLARRARWPVWATVGLLLGIVAVAVLTLSPAPGSPVQGPTTATVAQCARTLADPAEWLRALVATYDRGERVGNVLMFVPASFFAVLATHRPVAVALVGTAAPVFVELGQSVIAAGRDCAADDWVNNATGVWLGVAAGALVLGRLVRTRPSQDRPHRTQQDDQIQRE